MKRHSILGLVLGVSCFIPSMLLAKTDPLSSALQTQEYQEALPDDVPAQKALGHAVKQPIIHTNGHSKKVVVAHAAASDSQIAVLLNKVMQLNKDVTVYQQNAMQRIDNLKRGELQLQQNLQKMQQLMQAFNKQVQVIQSQQGRLNQLHAAHPQDSWWSSAVPSPGMLGLYAGLALVLLMLLGVMWRIKPRPKPVAKQAVDPEAEYDFMSTNEAIPAKLDLARAYMAMDDFDSARGVVAEVFAKGTDLQKQQAQALLDEMGSNQEGGQ